MVKRIVMAAMLAAALSAGALSLHQLKTGTHAIVACGSFCKTGDLCKRPCGCCFGPAEGPRASASLNALHQRGRNRGTEKGEIMLKKILVATMFMGVLSASALSVRQLRTAASSSLAACGSPCNMVVRCARPCFCFPASGGKCVIEVPPAAR